MNILFIAENANTGCDFYEANTSLFKVVKQAFEEQFTREFSNEEFLLFFSACGCMLEHLCVRTITKESREKRAAARKKCIPDLAERIKLEQPSMLITLLNTIVEEVNEAIEISGVKTIRLIRTTVNPAKDQRNRASCIEGIKKALREAEAEGILTIPISGLSLT